MKFYEVQKALEEGKKIKRYGWDHYLHIDEVKVFMGVQPFEHIIIFNNDGSTDLKYYTADDTDLLADDWEIIEDIPDVKLFQSKKIHFICPKCLTYITLSKSMQKELFCSGNTQDTIHECKNCGQKSKFSNFNEMENEYYDDFCKNNFPKLGTYNPFQIIGGVKTPKFKEIDKYPDSDYVNSSWDFVNYPPLKWQACR